MIHFFYLALKDTHTNMSFDEKIQTKVKQLSLINKTRDYKKDKNQSSVRLKADELKFISLWLDSFLDRIFSLSQ